MTDGGTGRHRATGAAGFTSDPRCLDFRRTATLATAGTISGTFSTYRPSGFNASVRPPEPRRLLFPESSSSLRTWTLDRRIAATAPMTACGAVGKTPSHHRRVPNVVAHQPRSSQSYAIFPYSGQEEIYRFLRPQPFLARRPPCSGLRGRTRSSGGGQVSSRIRNSAG